MNDAPPPLFPPSSQPPQALPPQGQPPYQAPPQKSRCGKGLGCGMGCLVVVGLCIAGLIFGGVKLKNYFGEVVEQYTAMESVPIEAPQASPGEITTAVSKFDDFKSGMEAGATPVPLTLTGEELNLILFNHPSFAALAGKANVEIVDDQLLSRVSVDFSEIPIPEGFIADALQGKFFNGEVGLTLGMSAGRPALYLESLAVNGAAVPEAFMSGLRAQNFLEEVIKNDPDAKAFFDRIEDMRIEGGQLIIVPKAAP